MKASPKETSKKRSKSFIGIEVPIDDEALSLELGFNVTSSQDLEKAIFLAVNQDDRPYLLKIFEKHPSPTTILQILLTSTYPNKDRLYAHDPEDELEAEQLLGSSIENINAIQIACLLGEEDIALEILEFVTRIAEEIDARIVLYEFMGRMWGEGNTILHLASFMGMSKLTRQLIELGAATSKSNFNNYKPVDCAGDEETRKMFETVVESNCVFYVVDKAKRQLSEANQVSPFLAEPSMNSPLLFSPRTPVMKQKTIVASPSDTEINKKSTSSLSKPLEKEPTEKKSNSTDSIQATPVQVTIPPPSKPKRVKGRTSVSFDPKALLLYYCHYGGTQEDPVAEVKSCIQAIKSNDKEHLNINNIYLPQQWLSPLHIACSHGHYEIAKYLITEANAAVNIEDIEGWTPLHCAAAEGHLEIIKLLGTCQGSIFDEKKERKDILYVYDGPIDLEPLNDDEETPVDVAMESKAGEVKKVICDLIAKYQGGERIENVESSECAVDVAPIARVPSVVKDAPSECPPSEDHLNHSNHNRTQMQEPRQIEETKTPKTIEDFSANLKRAVSIVKRPTRIETDEDQKHHKKEDFELFSPTRKNQSFQNLPEDEIERSNSPSGESRKTRRTSFSRPKDLPKEIETLRSPMADEPIKRVYDLQRRSSKSRDRPLMEEVVDSKSKDKKDSESKDKDKLEPTDSKLKDSTESKEQSIESKEQSIETKSIQSVSSLKKEFIKKEEKMETVRVVPVVKSMIQDRIKQLQQPNEVEPLIRATRGRILATSSNDAELTLDINSEIYPLETGEMINLILIRQVDPLNPTPKPEWKPNQRTIADEYEYSMVGKVYKYEDLSNGKSSCYCSFGGLLMLLVSDYRTLNVQVGQYLYLLIRK